MLHPFDIFTFSPSMPGVLCSFSSSNSLATPFGSNVIYSMEENELAPFEVRSESHLLSVSRAKAAWNCLLQKKLYVFWTDRPGLEVMKLEFILRLKIKRTDWLLADTRAANHCALFRV